MFRKIVVGCDGSPQSYDALVFATRLAELSGAGLMLSYVYDQQPRWYSAVRDYERERREDIHSVLEPALEAVPDSVRVQSLGIGSSSPARGLHDLAEGEKADLLVLGSTHRGRVGRVLPGSVDEMLLSGAPCGVAVAPLGYRDHQPAGIGAVGAGFDGSAEAELALASADRLATALGASLQAIAVTPRHRLRGNGQDGHPLEERLHSALRALGRSSSDGQHLVGEPATALADAASDLDLMVAGSRGYGPMQHVLLGSVSGPLMRTCPCPLIVLPRTAPSRDWDVAQRDAVGTAS